MTRLRVLITNHGLAKRGGSELYVRDLAAGLMARGHDPIVYSTISGEIAGEIRRLGIPVVEDLHSIGKQPDLIHGHHHVETMTALLHFANVPAIYVCHGWLPWEEEAPRFPRIRHYVAVSELCRERLISERGIPAEQTSLILNFVDLDRFPVRDPLPPQPRTALLFSGHSPANSESVQAMRQACGSAGLSLDVVGADNPTSTPERLLPAYDLVFATGRSALEAVACGCAVIVYCAGRVGPMVSSENIELLRRENFGLRAATDLVRQEVVLRAISRYDAADAGRVSARIRSEAGLADAVRSFEPLYANALVTSAAVDAQAESRAAAAYIAELGRIAKQKTEAVARAGQQLRNLGAALGAFRGQALEASAALAEYRRSRPYRLAEKLVRWAHIGRRSPVKKRQAA